MSDPDSTDAEGRLKELRRAHRVSDQLVSCHAALRDMYNRRAMAIDLMMLTSSAAIVALAFGDVALLTRIGLGTDFVDLGLRAISLLLFVTSIIQLKLAWKEKAGAHQGAAKNYASLKLRLGEELSSGCNISQTLYQQLMKDYHWLGQMTEPVPEDRFLFLKKRHRTKVEISKMLDSNPSISILHARCILWCQSLRASQRGSVNRND